MSGYIKNEIQTTDDGNEFLEWIANFGGTVETLQTLFGLSSASVKKQLASAEAKGWVESRKVQVYGAKLYLATPEGMRQAGLRKWAHLLWLREAEDEVHQLAVAAVAAAHAVQLEREPGYKGRFEVRSSWWIRGLGRKGKGTTGRYEYQATARVGDEIQRHLPDLILAPAEGEERFDGDDDYSEIDELLDGPEEFSELAEDLEAQDAPSQPVQEISEAYDESPEAEEQDEPEVLPILVEVITDLMDEAELRSILSNRARRRDISFVMCYVHREQLKLLWKVILDLAAEEKIFVYQLPAGMLAEDLLKGKREPAPKVQDLFTEEDAQTQMRILQCIGDFQAATAQGIVEHLGLGDQYAQWLINGAVKAGLLVESATHCDGVSVYWLGAKGIARVELEEEPFKLGVSEARRLKECLRLVTKLNKTHDKHIVMSAAQYRFAGEEEQVPEVMFTLDGRPEMVCADVTVRPERTPKAAPMVAYMVLERAELKAMPAILQALAASKEIATAIVYIERKLLPQYKGLVDELGVAGKVSIQGLPRPEQAIIHDRTQAERQRKAEVSKQIQARRSKARYQRRRELAPRAPAAEQKPERKTPARSRVIRPPVANRRPISDESAKVIERLLKQREVKTESWLVNWRLIVNLAVWCTENQFSFKQLRTEVHGISVGTFERRVYLLHYKEVWPRIPGVLETLEPTRPKLDWGFIDISSFSRANQYISPRDDPSAGRSSRQRADSERLEILEEELPSETERSELDRHGSHTRAALPVEHIDE